MIWGDLALEHVFISGSCITNALRLRLMMHFLQALPFDHCTLQLRYIECHPPPPPPPPAAHGWARSTALPCQLSGLHPESCPNPRILSSRARNCTCLKQLARSSTTLSFLQFQTGSKLLLTCAGLGSSVRHTEG